MKNLAVFVSGTGSLLEAMIKEDRLPIGLVLADRKCRGLEIAQLAGIATEFLERKDFSPKFNYYDYTMEVVNILCDHEITFVAMAGFMTILDPIIFNRYRERILNTHPALLPAFKGDHAVRDALVYGVKVTGCTIHIATEELDAGRILAQEPVLVMPGYNEKTLHERIKQVERRLYPLTIRRFAETL